MLILDVELIRMACVLEEILSEGINVDTLEICKQPNIPGTRFYIVSPRAPIARCNVIEDILVELHERDLSFITIGSVCGGVGLASRASVVYKGILDGEIEKYLNLTPRCQLHQEPCRSCGSLATLYEKGGVKNLKLLETIKKTYM